MPRRRQGHFHVVRRANATSKTRNTIYNEEGKLSQPESVGNEEAQAIPATAGDGSPKAPPSAESDGVPPPPPPKEDTLWRVSGENGSSASLKEGFRYLHKKFKKMEAPSSEDAENGDQDAAVNESIHANVVEDVDDDLQTESSSKPASNPSLEALFQVTGHELQKIKCSEEEVAQSPGSHAPSPGDTSAPENGLLLAPDERELGKRLRRHVCPYCGLACGKPSVLQKHVRAHTNERPYPCVPCGFAFKTKSNLYKHCKSRAHHLKVVDGGATMADVGDDADVIETDDSTNSDEEGATSAAEFVERMRTPDEAVASTSASVIYKPKFHSVAYLTASSRPRGSTEAALEANADCNVTAADCTAATADCVKRFALPSPLGTARNNGAVQKEGATIGLAKRRNEQFQLRLEIPGPRAAYLPSLSSSSASSSSSSSSSAASISSAATPVSAVTNRLPLPATAAGFPSPRHQRSPKLASPEYLQQHISNLISQNAAIVETLDPLWPRRYTRQSSVASSHNVDAELRSKERLRRLSEDAVAAPSQAKSKLALALLSATTRTTSQSTSATVEVLADAPYRPATVVTYRPPNKVAVVDDATSRRIPTPESDSGSIVKSLLMASGLNKTSSSSSLSQSTRPPETHHPQNPEGSIIKDLLLKTRSVATTPTATCMRLSGGSISTSSATAVAPVDEPSSEGATTAGPYTCNLCHISYRKAENLEIHCAHYCQKGPRPQFASTPPPPPSPNVVETPPAGVTVSLSATLDTASAIPVQPTGSITVPKPRGRPRGSKNRPKYEAPPVALAGRVHSKSVSESAAEPPSKERPAFRRNSISGELSDSIKDILMSRSLFGSDGAPPTDSIVLVPPSTTATGTPQSADDGPILKKHLLAGGPEGDKSPPLKKRKIPEDALQTDGSALKKDVTMVAAPTVLSLKSLEQLSRYPMRPSAVRLFGGEVQICDGAETKKIIIDHKMQSMLPSGSAGGNGSDAGLGGLQAADTTSSVVATIAKPVHNSGGTVLQVQEAKSAPPVCIPVVAVARPLMATGTPAAVLLSPAPVATVAIDISQLKLGLAPKPALSSIVLRPDAAKTPTSVRTSVTVTDCTTSTSTTTTDSNGTSKRLEVPVIHIQDVPKTSAAEVASTSATVATVTTTTAVTKSLLALPRPTSLLLKNVHTSMAGMTLVSPETPRPKKKYGQCYINGQYYTYLELKQSTRVYYCNCRPQPMYVPQSVDPKLSMYSMWQTVPAEPDPFGLTPPQAMSLYASKPRYQAYAIAGPRKMPLVVTHSSYWTFQQKEKAAADGAKKSPTATLTRCPQEENASETQELESKSTEKSDVEGADGKTAESMERSSPIDNDEDVDVERTTPSPVGDPKQTKTDLSLKHRLKDSGSAVEPKRVRIFEGGFKSNEDYTYVRGRGRGKYVCEECGIRCKKPSMLKKHIRTHTDVRPYTCKHCNFSFKTKGNLTKHMKSKAHHKKCVVLGIVPVPVTIDDAQIDEEALARQERIEHQRKQFADDEDSLLEDDDDEDDEDEEEDDEDEGHEEYKEGEDEDDESLELDGQFEDASETPVDKLEPPSGGSPKPHSEQEIAKSLLELGQTEPTLTSSASLVDIAPVMAQDVIETPRSLECVGEPCDEREELIGNPRVVWSSSGRNLTEVTSSNSGLGDRLVRTMDNDADVEGDEYPVRPVQCLETMDEDDDESGFTSRPLQRTDKEGARSTLYLGGTTLAVEETDQPMDLSMPHSRPEDGYDDVLEEDRPKRIDDGGTTDLHALNPYYNAPPPQYAPEPERHRGSSPRCYENISPAGSVELHRQLPLPAHSPYQPAAPPMEPVRDWTSKPPTPPPPPPSRPSVLHTYLSEQPPSKRMAMAAPPRGGSSRRHRSSSTSSACGGRKSPTLYSSPVMFGFASTASSPPPPLPPPSSARAESPPEILSPVGLSDGPPSRGLPPVGISNLAMYIHRSMDDGKCICTICNKAFSKPSHLRLHVNIHYFERPFRCDSCAISFRTKGHLQKHKRSVSHYNKVNMNMTFGTPTTDNPRPFKCEDCKIAFRIHGHLAKHLRSKMHIMKLECLGKLPFGTYAEIERSGANLNEIDTTDCENSLESLQVMAHRLVEKDPTVQRWPRERTISGGSCDDQSDGLPYVESPVGSGGGVAAPSAGHYRSQSVGDDGCASPDFADAGRLVMWSQRPFESNLPPSPDSGGTVPLPGIKLEPAEGSDIPHLVDPRPGTVATVGTARRQDGAVRLELGQRTSSAGSLVQDYEDISDDDESEVESPRRGGAVCRICGEVVKSAKFLQLHMFVNHVDGGSVPKTGEEFPPAPMVGVARKLSSPPLVPPTATSPSWRLPAYSTLPAAAVIEEQDYVCELCSEVYPNGHTLKQHMMMHARLRPYICELCDAGFTTSHYLKLHLQTHQQGKVFACQECHQSFGLIEELERHVDHVHPSLDGEQVR